MTLKNKTEQNNISCVTKTCQSEIQNGADVT